MEEYKLLIPHVWDKGGNKEGLNKWKHTFQKKSYLSFLKHLIIFNDSKNICM